MRVPLPLLLAVLCAALALPATADALLPSQAAGNWRYHYRISDRPFGPGNTVTTAAGTLTFYGTFSDAQSVGLAKWLASSPLWATPFADPYAKAVQYPANGPTPAMMRIVQRDFDNSVDFSLGDFTYSEPGGVPTFQGRIVLCGNIAFDESYREGLIDVRKQVGDPPAPAASVEQYGPAGQTAGGESPLCAQARAEPRFWRDPGTGGTGGQPGDPNRRATSSSVGCNRGPNPGDPYACTARVANVDARQGRATPTGTATFVDIRAGNAIGSCGLGASATPGVAICTATFGLPGVGAGGAVPVSVSYGGSSLHLPAEAASGDAAPSETAPPPPRVPSDTRRLSGTRMTCARGPQPTDDALCTAEVGDGGPAPSVPPTGTVLFEATRGGFVVGPRCVLQRTSASPNVSFCAVVYRPDSDGLAAGTVPPIKATYEGSTAHRPSTATLQLVKKRPKGPLPTLSEPPGGCGGPAASRVARPRLTQNTFTNPNTNPDASSVSFYGQICLYNAIGGVSRGVQIGGTILGGTVAVSGAVIPLPGAQTVTLPQSLLLGGNIIGASVTGGQAVINTTDRWIQDPPRKDFAKTTVVAKTAKVRVSARGRLSRTQATLLGGLLTDQLRLNALARATSIALDRAGGAQKAGNAKRRVAQTRAAVRFSREMATKLDAVAARLPTASRALRAFPQLRQAPTAAQAARLRRSARQGLPRGLDRGLAGVGATASERKAIARSIATAPASTKRLSAVGLLADPGYARELREAAIALRRVIVTPDVVAIAKR